MPITVHCNGCGNRYSVPDSAMGKQVRCIACGSEFTVRSGINEANPLDGLSSAHFESAPTRPPEPPPTPRPIGYMSAMGKPKPRAPQGEDTPWGELVDLWLPRLLVLFFYGPIFVLQLIGACTGPLPPIAILFFVVQLALLVWVVLPIADWGLRAGGSLVRVTIREETRFKIFAAYCPVPVAMVLATLVMLGLSGALHPANTQVGWRSWVGPILTGIVLGVSVSFFLLWLFFHLKFVEAIVAWVFTSVAYVFGLFVAGFVMFLIMLPIRWILREAGWTPPGTNLPPAARSPIAREPIAQPPIPHAQRTPRTMPPSSDFMPGSIPQRDPAQLAAMQEQTKQNLQQIQQALATYAASSPQGQYPLTLDELVASGKLTSEAAHSAFNPLRPISYTRPSYPQMTGDILVAFDQVELEETRSTHALLKSGSIMQVDATALRDLRLSTITATRNWERNQRLAATSPPGVPRNVDPQQNIVTPQLPPTSRPSRLRRTDLLAQFEQDKSPLVRSIQPFGTGEMIHQIFRPIAPSPMAALVREDETNQEIVEVWDLIANKKISEATFAHDPGSTASYAINAAGTTLARIARWPKLSVRIWSLADQKETRSVALNDKFGVPDLVGFLAGDKLAVRWTRGFQEGLEIWDASTGQHGKQVNLERYTRSANNGVISPDGKYFALVATQTRTNKPQLQVYDLLGPSAGYRWVALPELDAATASAPAGLAFSPDGKKLAALFAHHTEGIIFCWRTSDEKRIGDYSIAVPAPPPGARTPAIRAASRLNFASGGRGLDWLNDGKTWLVMNDLLLDVSSSRQIGRLNCPPASDQWSLDGQTIAVRFDTSMNDVQIAKVKLDPEKMAAPTTTPAPQQ